VNRLIVDRRSIFVIVAASAFASSCVLAAILIFVGVTRDNVGAGLAAATIAMAFSFPPFLVAFSISGLVFDPLARSGAGRLGCWVYFPGLGACAGFGIPFLIGAMTGSPMMAASAGLVGGLVAAGLWTHKAASHKSE
jgi:hypothetical protein